MTTKNVKNAAISGKQRVVGRPFQKGVSGNPTGRPGGYEEFRALCKARTPEAVAALVAALGNSDASSVGAARVLLEYAWGKPASAPEDLDALKDSSLGRLTMLTRDEILAIAKGEEPK